MSVRKQPAAQVESHLLSHRIAKLEAENERLRAQVQVLRHDRAEFQEMLRREAARCSNA